MKTYWRLLGFAKPIEKYAIPYFFCTLLYAFFNVCTFTLIMPIVNSLFSPDGALHAVTEMPAFSIRHLTEYLNALLSYFLYRLFGSDYDIMDVLVVLACVVVAASLLSNLFRYLAQRIIENMRVRTLCRLRDRVYEHVLEMNLGFFSNERKGDIMARITSDVQVVQFCITNTLQVAFRDPFLILFYVAAMLAISIQLSVFSVVYLPVVALLIGTIVKRLRRSAKEVQESFGELTSVLDESLSGMKVIKGYNAEGFFDRRFSDINRRFSDISRRIAYRQQLASPMSEFLGIAAAAGLLIFGGILVSGGKLDAGGFLTYLAIFTQITRPMRSFTDAFSTINQGIAAGDRVLALLDTQTAVRNAPDAVRLEHFRDSIEFRNVRFAYEEREVICGISFTVKKGQTVALVGPSGGGKSTISDLIPRFYDVTAGEIRIDGRDIRQYDLHSLREKMGIVAQDTVLFNDTIENNIRLGNAEATREEVMDAARVANAERFIAETPCGLDTNIGDRGAKLSGGQRQRLSIARAVLKNPEILILDEATSALDTESEKLVQEALNTLLVGRTSIVIAHRLSTIRNADKIIVIEQGRITEEGTHAELLRHGGTYAKLIELQQLS
ncbi:MAG TPA: ABC transporter ATP-binding protein/permease [Candidatus Tidjanibacter gallistercoris]|nr:ABC transporter ATP-binding protein/permease [Candidatus Tidjanibacter gallistercoris]